MFHVKHVPPDASDQMALLGVEPTEGFIEKLDDFAAILHRSLGGRFGNLVGPREKERLWSRHILESAAYIPFLGQARLVVDIGSGAGFPGIVLGLFGFRVDLVESRRKRSLFLMYVKDVMALENIRVIRSRLEYLPPFTEEEAVFTARAVEAANTLSERLAAITPGGFSLTTRVVSPEDIPGEKVVKKLPMPPLDRPGFMVQYRHPGAKKPRRNGGG